MTDFLLPISNAMSDLFLQILNMSLSSSLIIAVVLLLRLLLKKSPKWITVLLWGIVAVRLICPFSVESTISLMPQSLSNGEVISQWADDYVGSVSFIPDDSIWYEGAVSAGREPISDGNGGYFVVTNYDQLSEPHTVENTLAPILAVIWLIGILFLTSHTAISYLKLKHKIGTAILLRDNIYQSESVVSPFVLGVLKPKIFLPFNMNEQDMGHVIAHEQAHLSRKDHWWKPLGFLLLTLHWFNPMVWLGYVLLCRDIELACDEKVVKELNNEQRADYSQALLTCSVNRRMIAACPLAFGEIGVKDRVKSVLNYERPAFWIVMVAIIISFVVAICFLTNPKTDSKHKEYYGSGYSLQVVLETFKGTTQLPDKTENFTFDVLNGTEGELPNGTKFVITECNLQEGSLTIQLTGTKLFPVAQVNREQSKEIIVWENSDGVELTDENYMHFLTFSFIHSQSLDEAISQAILDDNKSAYYDFGTECIAEGHIVYGTEVVENKCIVYALTDYACFGFENGYFVEKSGGSSPAVMTFEKVSSGYKLLDIQYPQDGEGYVSSINELFPKKYQYRVMHPTSIDYNNLWKQKVAYAQAYLDEIGRTEEIHGYSQVEHTLFTDIGVSVEVSNKILEYNLPYNYDVGYFESIENNVRYIYRTTYDKKQNKIIFTKENYENKKVVEKIEIDSLTGDIISK